MRNFILPTIIFLLGLAGTVYCLTYLSPNSESGINYQNLGLLLFSLLFSLAPTLALVVYSLHLVLVTLSARLKLRLRIEKPRKNPTLRRGFFAALFVATAGFLLALKTASVFNISLLGIILILLESMYWKNG